MKQKFRNDFVLAVQDAAGFCGEFVLHGHMFSLKIKGGEDEETEKDLEKKRTLGIELCKLNHETIAE